MMRYCRRIAARTVLFLLVLGSILASKIAALFASFGNAEKALSRKVVMIGSFHSAGWLAAHAGPLMQSNELDGVIVVCDQPIQGSVAGIQYECPSPATVTILGRVLARFVTLCRIALTIRPAVYMGYHIVPNSLLALVVARLFGGRSIYQMTGGPIQVLDGGYRSENPLLKATGKPSRIQEKLLFNLLKEFDAVVVRGAKAGRFVEENNLSTRCIIITGAIDTQRFKPQSVEKEYDLIYVARLVANKGVEEFLALLAELVKRRSTLRAAVVGGGEKAADYAGLAKELGLGDHIQFLGPQNDVANVLKISRAFVLLSPSEGMSIAMLEAMSCGLPAFVRNVGDLEDALPSGRGGMLIDHFDAKVVAENVDSLLSNGQEIESLGGAARRTIVSQFSVEAITSRWEPELRGLMQ